MVDSMTLLEYLDFSPCHLDYREATCYFKKLISYQEVTDNTCQLRVHGAQIQKQLFLSSVVSC